MNESDQTSALYRSQVQRFYTEVWEQKEFTKLNDLLHQDFDFKGSLGSHHKGHASFVPYVNLIHRGLEEYWCVIEEVLTQSEQVFAKMRFSGMHTGELLGFSATHQFVQWEGAALFYFEGRKIKKLWVLGDVKQLASQLLL